MCLSKLRQGERYRRGWGGDNGDKMLRNRQEPGKGRQRETMGNKGSRNPGKATHEKETKGDNTLRNPAMATHMKGDKRRQRETKGDKGKQRETRRPGTRQGPPA